MKIGFVQLAGNRHGVIEPLIIIFVGVQANAR
jgi:hypothetical protein